jgi:biotin synthase
MERKIIQILKKAENGRAITKQEAVTLLSLPTNSLENSLLSSVANAISRQRFGNNALLLGQIGVDMAPCDGDCLFCFFAKSHSKIEPFVLSAQEIIDRCNKFASGGAQGAFLMTMHRFGFDWFLNLVTEIKKNIPEDFEILANVGDIGSEKLKLLKEAGVTGAYHVCRIREGTDTCMQSSARKATIKRILETGLDWYNMCEPIGPEHTPVELAEQIWNGVDYPATQHGAMQRFSVPGSPLFDKGQISLSRLGQIVSVIVLATMEQKQLKSIAVNVSNLVGLYSGANTLFPEAGEPEIQSDLNKAGFTTALWRQSEEITTLDCRNMLTAAGFSNLINAKGEPVKSLNHR